MRALPAEITIAGRRIGPGHPCFVIAEIAQAHDGSLGTAHAYIDAAARAGADAVKFQTHIAAAETTAREPWRVKFSRQDATRYDYWQRMEFTEAQWAGLAEHASEVGLAFLSSPFSFAAVELLERLGVPAWKIGGAEVANPPLIERAARGGRPVLISSGMAPWAELDTAVEAASRHGAPVAVFQCASYYPCPPEKIGLNVLAELRARYGCPVGLSDHSATPHAGIAAAALGAHLLEVHLVLSRECFGPDVSSSLTTTELGTLVDGVRFVERALAHPVDKDAAAAALGTMRRTFGRSVVAARALAAGTVLGPEDLAQKKPGGGIDGARIFELVGRTLARAVEADAALSEDDLAPPSSPEPDGAPES